ncbi:sulfotransferase domain-containing protein [Candidatus Neomarinimicrobiota bacterium]
MLPNFIIVGAPKCGTTSIWRYCSEHPDISMSKTKEPNYFSTNPGKLDLNQYKALFENSNNETMIGEASTSYLRGQEAAKRINKFIPNCKIIIMLRDPLDRLYSAYLYWKRLGLYSFPVEKLIQKYIDQQSIAKIPKEFNIISNGLYFEHVQRYFNLFGEENVFVGLFEDMRSEPTSFFHSLFSFLGVSTTIYTPDFSKKHNVGYDPVFPFYYRLIRIVVDFFRKILIKVVAYDRLIEIRNKVFQLNKKGSRPTDNKLSPKERTLAHDIFREDVIKLQSLIGRDLSEWIDI